MQPAPWMDIDCECCVPPPAVVLEIQAANEAAQIVRLAAPRRGHRGSGAGGAAGASAVTCQPCSSDSRVVSRTGKSFQSIIGGRGNDEYLNDPAPATRLFNEAWGTDGKGDPRSSGGGRGQFATELFGDDGKVFFLLAFGNVTCIDTSEGLVMIDTGIASVRAFSSHFSVSFFMIHFKRGHWAGSRQERRSTPRSGSTRASASTPAYTPSAFRKASITSQRFVPGVSLTAAFC